MKDRIYTIIYNWVAENFGTSEAEEPSWDIHALAEEIAEHAWEIHSMKQEEYDEEDIEAVAADMGVELNKDEFSLVLHRYKKLEDANLETINYIIKEVKGE